MWDNLVRMYIRIEYLFIFQMTLTFRNAFGRKSVLLYYIDITNDILSEDDLLVVHQIFLKEFKQYNPSL